jgi:hypothetical protein
MAHAFMCQRRQTPMRPRVTTRETMDRRSSVPTCCDRQRRVCTGRVMRPVGRGQYRQSRIDALSQTRTSVRLTPGDGAPGLSGCDRSGVCVLTAIARSWLRVLGTAELLHLDQGVRQEFHAKVSVLHVLRTKKQPSERILPRKGPIDASPQGMESDG